MNISQHIKDFISKSSLIIFFVATSFFYLTYFELTTYQYNTYSYSNKKLCLLISCLALVGYNYLKFKNIFSFTKSRKNNLIKIISIICLLLAFILYAQFFSLNKNYQEELCIGISFILTLFYKKNTLIPKLRNIPYLKIFIVAICWLLITYIIQIDFNAINSQSVFFIMRRFLLLITLLLLTEIKDINIDPKKIRNIPQQIGIFNTKLIVFTLILIQFIISFFYEDYNTIAFLVVLLFFTFFTTKNKSYYFYSILLEFLPILYIIMFWALSYLKIR